MKSNQNREAIFIDLGFISDVKTKKNFENSSFPSKMGGKPVWLNRWDLPTSNDLQCQYCSLPMIFLLQIYVPSEEVDFYHRSLFIFCCKDGFCHEKGISCFRVFRNQLKKINKFYDPENSNSIIADSQIRSLCSICGCRAENVCGNCKNLRYCSVAHQKWDWKENNHKVLCGSKIHPKEENNLLWPEYEIEVESEELVLEDDSDEAEAKRMQQYNKYLIERKAQQSSENVESFEQAEAPCDEENFEIDQSFLYFQEKLEQNPDQVIRYIKNVPEAVLWVSNENIPTKEDIPDCSNCSSARTIEFQVLPQLLNYMTGTDIDWGILSIYTCTNNCVLENEYSIEFIHRQLISSSPTVKFLKNN